VASSVSSAIGRFGRLLPRRLPGRSVLGFVIWTVAWFAFFLAITFPHDLIVGHWRDEIAANSGWQVRYDDVWLRPWNGYHLAQARLIAPGKDLEPWLSAPELVFRPSLSALVGASVYPFYFSGSAYGGRFEGSFDQSGTLDLTWKGLRMADYPRFTKLLEGIWSGELSGEIHLTGKGDIKNVEGRGKVGLKNASLTQGKAQGFTIPDLHFASGDADLELKAARLEIRSLKLSGSEVDADLHGQCYFQTAVPVVNASLNLKPIPGAPAGLESLLTLMNRNQKPPTGTYSFTVYGALNALRLR
jgi:type II secretion system protein N